MVVRLRGDLEVLLVKRTFAPFKDAYGLPGGYLEEIEHPESAVRREVFEETGMLNLDLSPLNFYGEPKRDPRHRMVSLSFIGLTRGSEDLAPSIETKEVKWFNTKTLPNLAFDHDIIIKDALSKLKDLLNTASSAESLIGAEFHLSDLQRLYEKAFGRELDRRNFRRKTLALKIVQKTNSSKPLYAFTAKTFSKPIVD